MKQAERDILIQTHTHQLKSLQKQWVENQNAETRTLLEEAYKNLDEAKKIPLTPEIGMGATGGCGSDCYPYTVVSISKDGKKIEVTQDDHTPTPGFDYYSNQVYTYTPRPEGGRVTYRLRKDGNWVRDGEPMRGGSRIYLGHRRYYQDPSF